MMVSSTVSVYDCVGKTETTSVMADATQDTKSTEVYFKQKEHQTNLSGVFATRQAGLTRQA